MGNYGSWTIIGRTDKYDNAGYQVAGIGDINGDGIEDFAVSALRGNGVYDSYYGYSGYYEETGTVYIVYGDDNPDLIFSLDDIDGTNGFMINPDPAFRYSYDDSTTFGVSVAGLGDVNGDGIDDFGIVQNGTSYGFYGYYGDYGYYGTSEVFATESLVVGSSSSTDRMGVAYVVFGGQDVSTPQVNVTDLDHVRVDSYDEIGRIVALGDVNGDGFADFGLDVLSDTDYGASFTYTYTYDANGNGYYDYDYYTNPDEYQWTNYYYIPVKDLTHYVVFGSDTAPTDSSIADEGNSSDFVNLDSLSGDSGFVAGTTSFAPGSDYGYSFWSVDETRGGHTGIADVNGDGFDDILFTSTGVSAEDSYYYSYYDPTTGEWTSTGETPFSYTSQTTIRNGDTLTNTALSGIFAELATSAGLGNFSGNDSADGNPLEEVAVQEYMRLSNFTDVTVGPYDFVDGVVVINGAEDLLDSSIVVTEENLEDGLGSFFYSNDYVEIDDRTYGYFSVEQVLGAGDVTGDGVDDLVIVGRRYTPDTGNEVRVYIVSGTTDARLGAYDLDALVADDQAYMIYSPEVYYSGGEIGYYAAPIVRAVGDVNGDGADDLAVGDRFANDGDGEAYIVFGGAALEASDQADGTDDNIIDVDNTLVDVDTGLVPIFLYVEPTSAYKYEGTGEDPTPFTFTVTRNGDLTDEVTVDYDVVGGGSTTYYDDADASDFDGGVMPSGTVTFASGSDTAVITILVSADSAQEDYYEDFQVVLSNGVAASGNTVLIEQATANGQILNDDNPMQFYVYNTSVTEGNPGDDTSLSFQVYRYGNTSVAGSVDYQVSAYSSASYTADSDDFEGDLPFTGTVEFAAGETTKYITIPIAEDTLIEGTEYVTATILNATSTVPTLINRTSATGTIYNDDYPMTFSVDDPSVTETDTTNVDLTFTITRSGVTDVEGSVDFTLAHYSTENEDFAAGFLDPDTGLPRTETVTFAAGETTKTVTLSVAPDDVWEGNEQVRIQLTNALNSTGDTATISDAYGYGRIDDDDVPAQFYVNNAYVTEGDTGTREMVFTITRSGNTDIEATVDYDLAAYTGSNAADEDDFDSGFPASGTLTFAAGVTSLQVIALVMGDTEIEGTEYVQITLSNPDTTAEDETAVINDALGFGYIYNDDYPVQFSVSNSTVNEGDTGETTTMSFYVSRSGETTVAATVDYSVESYFSNPANAADFESTFPTTGTLEFAAGETSKIIEVEVSGDIDREATEYFQVLLSNPTAEDDTPTEITDANGIGTIINDDLPVQISVSSATATEGSSNLTFWVYRNGERDVEATVDWSLTAWSSNPAEGDDLTLGLPQTGTVTFTAGQTAAQVVIGVEDDEAYEGTEYVKIELSNPISTNPEGIEITNTTAYGYIYDDETPVYLSISSGYATEGDEGDVTTMLFNITRTGDTTVDATVDYEFKPYTYGSSATDADFVDPLPQGGTVTFAAGETSKVVSIEIAGDNVYEYTEYFVAAISNATSTDENAQLILQRPTAYGYIYDDDTPMYFSAAGYSVMEGDPGDANQLRFVISRTGDTSVAGSVDYSIGSGTVDTDDFTSTWPMSGTANFAAGVTSIEILLDVNPDTEIEPDEYTYMTLTNPASDDADVAANISRSSAYAYIRTDDFPATLTMSSYVSVTEGDPGDDNALVFTIYRGGDLESTVSVNYNFAGDSYLPIDSADIEGTLPLSGTITFNPYETTQTLTFNIAEDTDIEGNERGKLTLSGATATGGSGEVTVNRSTSIGTIMNDDFPPRITMFVNGSTWGTSVNEGNSGVTEVAVTFVREGTTDGVVDVTYDLLSDALSVFGADSQDIVGFLPSYGNTVSFADGEATATQIIQINGDGLIEANERFTVKMTGVSASDGTEYDLYSSSAQVTIINDDGRPPFPELWRDYDGDGETDDWIDEDGDGIPDPGEWIDEDGDGEVDEGEWDDRDGDGEIDEGEWEDDDHDGILDPEEDEVIRVEADVFGDPHIITLDGLGYDFQAVGEYVLVETSDPDAENPFSVQIRFEAFPGSDLVSVATRIAVEVNGVSIELDALTDGEPLLIDGAAPDEDDLALGAIDVDGDGTADIFIEDGKYFIVLNEANETLMVGLLDGALQSCVFLGDPANGGNAGAVRGLMGNANQDLTDDFAMRDGSSIPESEMTFDAEGTPSLSFDFIYGRGDFEVTGGYRASWEVGDSERLFSDSLPDFPADFPAGPLTVDNLPDDIREAAEQAARDAGVSEDNEVIFNNAVLDFALTGMGAFLGGATQLAGDPAAAAEAEDAPTLTATVGVNAEAISTTEGDTGSQTVTFTFYRLGDTTGTVDVDYALGGAADADDLGTGTPMTGTVTFEDGESEVTLDVIVLGDLETEDDETLTVNITGVPEGVLIAGSQGLTTIVTDDFAPEAQDDAFSTDEDETLVGNVLTDNGSGADSDADDDTLTVLSFEIDGEMQEAGGSLTTGSGTLTVEEDGSFTFTAGSDFDDVDDGEIGEVQFSYSVSDGNGGTETATVSVTVAGADEVVVENVAPEAVDDSVTTDEDTAASGSVAGNDSDADGDTLTFSILSDVTDGTLTLNSDGSFTYTPDANFNGSDSFTYTVKDGKGGTDTATVSITVDPVNDDPTALSQNRIVDEDTTLESTVVSAVVNDVDGDTLTFSVDLAPEHGTLSLNSDGTFTYTPDADFNGADLFRYEVSDGNGGSTTAPVQISVTPVNDAPVAEDASASTDEDTTTPYSIFNIIDDVDGDDLTIESITVVSGGGTVTVLGDTTFSYTPDENYNGPVSIEYAVTDGTEKSNVGVIDITVNPVNDAPVADDDLFAVNEDSSGSGTVATNDSDVDGDTLTYSLLSDVTDGSLTFNDDGTFNYAPDADFNGSDSFTYTVDDGNGGTDTATATIIVNPVNDAPTASDSGANLDEDTTGTYDIASLIDDVDGDELSIESLTVVSGGGTVTVLGDNTFSYTPDADYNGPVSIEYTVTDGTETSNVGVIEINVTPVNDDPVAGDDLFAVNEDTSGSGTVATNDGDVDGDTLTYSLLSDVTDGSLTFNDDGTFTYTPDADFNGSDSFTYTVDDGNGGTDTATATIIVNPVNDAPVANPDAFTVAAGGSDYELDVVSNDTDVEGPVTVDNVTQPANGTVSRVAGSDALYYTPNAGFTGTDTFTYTVQDDDGTESEPTTVTISVEADPTYYAITDASVTEGGEGEDTVVLVLVERSGYVGEESQFFNVRFIDGTATAADPDYQDGTFVPFAFAAGQTEVYVPVTIKGDDTFEPDEVFALELYEEDTGTTVATGEVTILNDDEEEVANTPPVAVADSAITEEAAPVTIDALANDSDADGDTITLTSVGPAANGTVSIDDNGTPTDQSDDLIIYTAALGFVGTDAFTYEISDGNGGASLGTVTVEVVSTALGLVGTPGDDTLKGTSMDDTISGLSGDDKITGQSGDDDLNGGADDDRIYGGIGADTVTGGGGDDVLYGDNSTGATSGQIGNDLFRFGVDDGNDKVFYFAPGFDKFALIGSGEWSLTYNARYNNSYLTYGDTTVVFYGAEVTEADMLVPGGNVAPKAVADTASTDAYTAVSVDVLANDSDPEGDTISLASVSGASNGTVAIDDNGTAGDASDDMVIYTPDAGFAGIDTFTYTIDDGNGGVNLATVTVSVGEVDVDGTEDGERINTGAARDNIDAMGGDDTVNAGSGDDMVDGGSGDDKISGEDGDDTVMGGEGEDKISGDDGDDDLNGGADDDRIYGGIGADTIVGGDGDDVIYGDISGDRDAGATGADVFIFDLDDGSDKVFDFVSGVDVLNLLGSSEFEMEYHRDNTIVQFGSTTITLLDELLTEDDIFADDLSVL